MAVESPEKYQVPLETFTSTPPARWAEFWVAKPFLEAIVT